MVMVNSYIEEVSIENTNMKIYHTNMKIHHVHTTSTFLSLRIYYCNIIVKLYDDMTYYTYYIVTFSTAGGCL